MFKRIGAAILGALEGYFIGGFIVSQMNDCEFAGSVIGGVIGGALGFCLPIITVLVPFLLFFLSKRESKSDNK